MEQAVTNEVEEQLRTRLIDMIQNCQDQVFSMYRGYRGISTPSFRSETLNLSQETRNRNPERSEPDLLEESENRLNSRNITTVDPCLGIIGTEKRSRSEDDENALVPMSRTVPSERILAEHTIPNNPINDYAQPKELFTSVETSGQYESEDTETRQMPEQVADQYSDILFGDSNFFSSGVELGSTVGGLDSAYWRNECIAAQYGE